jgi:hypothetical protein
MRMKYLLITFLLVFSGQAVAVDNPWTFNHGKQSFKNWSKSHWKNQNFEPSIQRQDTMMRANVNRSDSLFATMDGVKPTEFIDNLKRARIIKRVSNPRTGFWRNKISPNVVIELDHNFYTLAYADQLIVTELLAKSYNQDTYLLRDAKTKNIVGQITPDGFHLF